MANITITIQDTDVNRVTDAFGYQPTDGSRSSFMKGKLQTFIKETVKSQERFQAMKSVVTTDVEIT